MRKPKRYAIVDIETTGGRASRDKITEIAIVLHNGEKIIDTYETLINPDTYIPYGITQLTGITQEMVEDAPRFYEVAKEIVEMTKNAIFVAHNVRFDYSFLRSEFHQLGFTYSRKQLCTVRLSRKSFPGLSSYSLDSLIRHLNLNINNRHRAMGDALATTELFEKILAKESSEDNIKNLVNLGIKESLLPKNLTVEKLHALPENCGVYYFHNENGEVVYVGKSINIKKRVAEHFSKKTEKASKLQQHVHEVTYEITGNELIALLLESNEIKRLRPPINRAQRLRRFPYVIYTYTNEAGYICFNFTKVTQKTRKQYQIISEHPKQGSARGRLEAALKTFELCARYCHLQPGNGACFNFHLKQCLGACAGQEVPESYNERARLAKETLSTIFEQNFFLIDKGRHSNEKSVVLVENGYYRGYGYLDADESIGNLEMLRGMIHPFPGNPETTRIIQRYLSQNSSVQVLPF